MPQLIVLDITANFILKIKTAHSHKNRDVTTATTHNTHTHTHNQQSCLLCDGFIFYIFSSVNWWTLCFSLTCQPAMNSLYQYEKLEQKCEHFQTWQSQWCWSSAGSLRTAWPVLWMVVGCQYEIICERSIVPTRNWSYCLHVFRFSGFMSYMCRNKVIYHHVTARIDVSAYVV